MTRVSSAAMTDVGRKRSNNEDYVAFFEPEEARELSEKGCLYIVADGVGGAARGERASRYAAEKVLYEYYRASERQVNPGELLRELMQLANRDIHGFAEDSLQPIRMATTMVAALVRGNQLIVANVGDSRAYLLRGGRVMQISRDHTLTGEMVQDGSMTEEEAMASSVKNRLMRSLGGEPRVEVDVFPPITLQPGDRILLCSDGLTRYALRDDLARLCEQGTPLQIVRKLVQFANARGGVDNISAILVWFEPPTDTPTLVTPGRRPQDVHISDSMPTMVTAAPVTPRRLGLMDWLNQFDRTQITVMISVVLICGMLLSMGLFMIIGSLLKADAPTPTPVLVTATPTPQPGGVNPLEQLPSATPTSTPAATLPPVYDCLYTVREGEFLGTIAFRFGVPVTEMALYIFNADGSPIADMNAVRANQQILIKEVDPGVCQGFGGTPRQQGQDDTTSGQQTNP